jgi:hypothetical protein
MKSSAQASSAPTSFHAALHAAAQWLASARTPGMLIGGAAANLLGRPRFTQDVDLLVSAREENWPAFLEQGKAFGIAPRISDPLGFAARARILLVRHVPSRTPLDVALAGTPFEEHAIRRARTTSVAGLRIPVVCVEDLIVMKAFAHRPLDMDDVAALLYAHADLDLRHVRRWLRSLCRAVDAPSALEDLNRLIAARARAQRRRARRLR